MFNPIEMVWKFQISNLNNFVQIKGINFYVNKKLVKLIEMWWKDLRN